MVLAAVDMKSSMVDGCSCGRSIISLPVSLVRVVSRDRYPDDTEDLGSVLGLPVQVRMVHEVYRETCILASIDERSKRTRGTANSETCDFLWFG